MGCTVQRSSRLRCRSGISRPVSPGAGRGCDRDARPHIHRREFWEDLVEVGEKVDDVAGRAIKFVDVVVLRDLRRESGVSGGAESEAGTESYVRVSGPSGLIHYRCNSVSFNLTRTQRIRRTKEHVRVLVPGRPFDDSQGAIVVDPDRSQLDQSAVEAAATGSAVEPDDESFSFRNVLVPGEEKVEVRVAIRVGRDGRRRSGGNVASKQRESGVRG